MKKKNQPISKVVNFTSTALSKAQNDDGSITIRGMASTDDMDRVGDVVSADAWNNGGLDNFNKNPIILFNHNSMFPIGKATKITPSANGLELEARISRAAANNVAELIEDEVLGAFSVSFLPKELDYSETADAFIIKEAELLEVSVVSIPCNQDATFSLAKSFDSMEEFEEFKKNFKNSADLAGQSLAGKDNKLSKSASEAPEGRAKALFEEMDMTKEELEQFAKDIAQKTAADIEMKHAERKAAEEKAAKEKAAKEAEEKALAEKQEEEKKVLVTTAVETGAEKLLKEFEEKLKEKDANFEEVMNQFKKDLEEKNEEITKMRQSKRVFDDRNNSGSISDWGKEFLNAKLVGLATGKGWETDYAKDVFEKAGINYTNAAADIDQEVGRTIEKEIRLQLRAAMLFREIRVNGGATVLPIQPESEKASWVTSAPSGNLEKRGDSDNEFDVQQVILNAYRLVSSTYIDDDVDEQVLVNLLPMLVDAVAHAHARAIDDAIINGAGSITGLDGYATASGTTLSIGSADKLTAANLLTARTGMGKYGINPRDIAYIVSQNSYYDLLEDSNFSNIDEVGSDLAIKVTGTVGGVYGSPVVVSDNFASEAAGIPAAFAVNIRNYVIPRLRDVRLERDREVANQRDFIVAAQSLGFEELVAGTGNNQPSMKIDFVV